MPGVKVVLPLDRGPGHGLVQRAGDGALVRGMTESGLKALPLVADNIRFGTLNGFDEPDGHRHRIAARDMLRVNVGDTITLVSPRGAQTPFGTAPRTKPYEIKALFEMGMSEYDRTMIFMPLLEAQRYFSRGSEVDALEIVISDPEQVDAYSAAIRDAAGPGNHISDWRQRNETFFTVLAVERNVMFVILSLIVLVAALNIISGLMMLVKDKGRDVAILRTMGATRGAMMRVFLITGASIGVVGTLAGLVLGDRVLPQHRIDPRVDRLALEHHAVRPQRLLSDPAAGRHGRARDRLDRRHGACAFGAGDALSVVARLDARSRRSPEVRVSERMSALAEELRYVQEPARQSVLRLDRLVRTYRQGTRHIEVLAGASTDIHAGEAVALVGPSGAGKSTLLHIAGLLETPDSGHVVVNGRDCAGMNDQERTRVRRIEMGFIYQFHQLLPEFSALENVVDPADDPRPQPPPGRRARAPAPVGAGSRRARRSSPGGAVGRRAAAHRDRPRARQRAAPHSRRRADRQPRPAHGRASLRSARRISSARPGWRRSSPPTTSSSPGAWTACCASSRVSSSRCPLARCGSSNRHPGQARASWRSHASHGRSSASRDPA